MYVWSALVGNVGLTKISGITHCLHDASNFGTHGFLQNEKQGLNPGDLRKNLIINC